MVARTAGPGTGGKQCNKARRHRSQITMCCYMHVILKGDAASGASLLTPHGHRFTVQNRSRGMGAADPRTHVRGSWARTRTWTRHECSGLTLQ